MKLAVGVPWQQEMMPSHWVFDLFQTDIPKAMMPGGMIRGTHERIDYSKNGIVERALELGADEILFLDADEGVPPDCLARLRSHKKDIVSGLVPMRRPPHFFSAFKKTADGQYLPAALRKGLNEIDAFGGGCTLVKAEVFRKIPYPWFLNEYDDRGNRTMGQDIYFCRKAQEHGYTLYMDWSCHCTHDAKNVIDHEYAMACIQDMAMQDALRRRMEPQRIITKENKLVLAR